MRQLPQENLRWKQCSRQVQTEHKVEILLAEVKESLDFFRGFVAGHVFLVGRGAARMVAAGAVDKNIALVEIL